jgi:uncharacterized protein
MLPVVGLQIARGARRMHAMPGEAAGDLPVAGHRRQKLEMRVWRTSRFPAMPSPTSVGDTAIRRLSLFGSVLRDDFGPESDVDVLVEFEEGVRVGLLGLAAMELELSEMLGRRADLRTPGDLSRYFRDQVLRSAEVQYAA